MKTKFDLETAGGCLICLALVFLCCVMVGAGLAFGWWLVMG